MLPSSWTLSDAWLSWGTERLIAGSLQGAVAAAVVWLVCRRVTTIPPAMRALLWWLVSLKLVASLVTIPSLPVPLLPAVQIDAPISVTPGASAHSSGDVAAGDVFVSPAPRDTGTSTVRLWMIAGMGLWLAGVLIHGVRLLRVFAALRRTLRESTRVGDEDAAIADRMARHLGLRITPDVRVAARVSTPFVAGLLRPAVLLPQHAISTLTPDERAMAICHELAHVRRRDLLFGWVPAIAERLFFFHPLARLAAREYAAEREAACDALVLEAMDIAPRDYGRMLVRLGVSGLTPVFTASGSSPSRSVLRRRLDMLSDVTRARARRRTIAFVAVVFAAAIVPFHLVAQGPVAVTGAAAAQTAAPGSAAPAQVRPVPVSPVPQVVAPKEAAPVGAAQAPADKRPASPSAQAVDAAQVQKAIEEQRARVRETERALNKMLLALEALYAQQKRLAPGGDAEPSPEVEAIRAAEARQRAEADRRAEEMRRRQQDLSRAETQRTGLFLQEQMRALTAQQDQMRASLEALSAQIEQIRKQFEAAREAERLAK